ncbi:MAG: cysteine desulfurase family protein [Bacteroidetes bacterium]|nr:cysteine desulfurase family protein [Bacteroidota bacterium]
MMEKIVYLDNNATTKPDPRVLEAMMPYLTEEYGNAASNHEFGVRINQAVNESREKIANLIGSETNEIIFTSGATEAINIAIKGIAEYQKSNRKHIVTVQTEHPAVMDTCKYLEIIGYEITYLPVQRSGLVDLDLVKKSVRDDTSLVCVMHVNNETGVIQPIKNISEIAHAKEALFMTDATQSIGKIYTDINDLGVDIMSFSAHKFYGPKGVGALYLRRRGLNKAKASTLIHGGGHERGMRSGTLNVPGIVGFGRAAEISKFEMSSNIEKISKLRNYLEAELLKVEGSFLNGDKANRLYNVCNICFRGADADAIIIDLRNIMISNGSACSSTKIEPSHVLSAMGLNSADCYSSLRLSLGKFNTKSDIDYTIKKIKESVISLRLMN